MSMSVYEVRTDDGRVFRMSGTDPEHAARRVADLHQVTVVAWRTPPVHLGVGIPDDRT